MPSNIQLFEKYNKNKVFIETGTYAGEGVRNAIFAGYKEIHSIELAEKWYYYCKGYFKYIPWVYTYLGDSIEQLPSILSKLTQPATIWLDAHYSGGDTAFKNVITPLLQEIDIIKSHHIKTHTIIIDDLREWRLDYPAIRFGTQEIKDKIMEINPSYVFSLHDGYVPQDVLVAEVELFKPINIVVFSKDRAMQLDLFIRSFKHYVVDPNRYVINVLYTYSNSDFSRGYDKLINRNYENVKFIKETNFKANLLSLVNSEYPHTVFFVDDNVFKMPFHFYDRQMNVFNEDGSIICRSLRLHKHLSYCYPAQIPLKPPKFMDENIFDWRGQRGDYGYPMSLDGHIFRTGDILPYLQNLEYANPNLLESVLVGSHIALPNMICYDKSIVVNNAINKVQTVNNNVHGNISAESLNNRFLNDEYIKLEPFDGLDPSSCHTEFAITYGKPNEQ